MKLFLASGTDLKYVRQEAELLQLSSYFGDQIHGAVDDYQNFSKKMVIERILADHGLHGEELLGFGDGFVEIEEIKKVGGVAVAGASDEVAREGVNARKRHPLVESRADLVIPQYRNHELLFKKLFDEN